MKLKIPLPAPLKASDDGSFAQYSVVVRLHGIGQRILKENSFPQGVEHALESLFNEIPHAGIRMLTDRLAPDSSSWEAYLAPYLGQNWLEIPWFLAETYFYRRVLEATQYFIPGDGKGYDPYFRQKRLGLESNPDELAVLAPRVDAWLEAWKESDLVGELMKTSLFGNQADLSMWPVGHNEDQSSGEERQGASPSRLLVDDTPEIARLFSTGRPLERVDLILDNAGLELVSDLCMADTLLSAEAVRKIILHAKMYPTFVSDVVEQDILLTLDYLLTHPADRVRVLAERLYSHLKNRRLRVESHPFWTSPLAGWEMPPGLHARLVTSSLIISKGDANYRRWLGDRHWPFTTPVAAALGYLPAPLASLRMVKSEVMVGLQPGQPEAAASADPDWMIDGQWGIIQFQP